MLRPLAIRDDHLGNILQGLRECARKPVLDGSSRRELTSAQRTRSERQYRVIGAGIPVYRNAIEGVGRRRPQEALQPCPRQRRVRQDEG